MASIKGIQVTASENGVSLSLGLKTEVLDDKDIDSLLKALTDLKPNVKFIKRKKLENDLTTAQILVETLQKQLKDLEEPVDQPESLSTRVK